MGREVRRVPANWEHPKNERGHYIPLRESEGGIDARVAKWYAEQKLWARGEHPAQQDYSETPCRFTDWEGDPPNPDDYMPDWPESERTHLQMYETCSEGTPISPVFATPESLARWLADTGASAFASMTATYEEWLAVARGGWAPSAVIADGRLMSVVEATAEVKA